MVAPNISIICEQAKSFYYNYLTGDGREDIPSELLEHMESCWICKLGINKLQTQLTEITNNVNERHEVDSVVIENLELHFRWIGQPVTCNVVKSFLPGLAEFTLSVNVPTPITSHIDNCHQCAEDLETICELGLTRKQLYVLKQIYGHMPTNGSGTYKENMLKSDALGIMDTEKYQADILRRIFEREESGISTIFTADRPTYQDMKTGIKENFSDWPIEVQVLSRQDKVSREGVFSEAVDKLHTRSKKIFSFSRFRPFVRRISAVAAVLMVALFVFYGTAVQALDISQVYAALEKISNVHIVRYIPEETESIQDMWISQPLNVKMYKGSAEYTLWDLSEKKLKIKDVNTGLVKTAKIDNMAVEEVRGTMHAPWSLLPFNDASKLPEGAVWKEVKDKEVVSGLEKNIDVYDLSWTEKRPGQSTYHYKWRVFINTKSHLPQKLEFREKFAQEEPYELTTTLEIGYLTDDELRETIEQIGF
ncbi:MAG: hypothetical protein JW912_03030 [Sedimentisphaerales bacterium]|nr:hypothetical protein [Sedimentisphaerales bacterium]